MRALLSEGCNGAFIKAAVFEQHYKDAHPDAAVFPCHLCGLRASCFGALIGVGLADGWRGLRDRSIDYIPLLVVPHTLCLLLIRMSSPFICAG